MKTDNNSRRQFIKNAALGSLLVPSYPYWLNLKRKPNIHVADSEIGDLCVFSKHLQFLDYTETAETAAEIGFDGVDLSVRPGGHVLPEKVREDLPRAVEAIKKAGLSTPMMTTSITKPGDPFTRDILQTAAGLGIKHYRMGWVEYDPAKSLPDNLKDYLTSFRDLSELNKEFGIIGDYQNHSGLHVGAPVWDIYQVLEHLEPDWIGCQYDIYHATVEGGNCWPLGMELVSGYVHSIVIKDFYWERYNHTWKISSCPVGEGMVNFSKYFELYKKYNISAPVSLHFEYPLTDKPEKDLSKAEIRKQVIPHMKKDLAKLRSLIQEAGISRVTGNKL